MSRKPFLFLLLITQISASVLFSQKNEIMEGAYRNLVEFHRNKPFIQNVDFGMRKSRNSFYRIGNKRKGLSQYIVSKGIWAIYHDSSFYINLFRLGMGTGYAKLYEVGRYSFFIGRPTLTVSQKDRMKRTFFYYGPLVLAASSISINKEGAGEHYYFLNLKNGMPEVIDKRFVNMILSKEEDIYKKFSLDPENESLDCVLKYVSLLNQRLSVY